MKQLPDLTVELSKVVKEFHELGEKYWQYIIIGAVIIVVLTFYILLFR